MCLVLNQHHVVPEIRDIRSSAESQLQCGVPNIHYVFKEEDSTTPHQRRKRLVGGEEALPVSLEISKLLKHQST